MSKFTADFSHGHGTESPPPTLRQARMATAHEGSWGGGAEPAQPPEPCPTMAGILAKRDRERWPPWLHRLVNRVLYWWGELPPEMRCRPWRMQELVSPGGMGKTSVIQLAEALTQCGWLRVYLDDGQRCVACWVHPDMFASVLLEHRNTIKPY